MIRARPRNDNLFPKGFRIAQLCYGPIAVSRIYPGEKQITCLDPGTAQFADSFPPRFGVVQLKRAARTIIDWIRRNPV